MYRFVCFGGYYISRRHRFLPVGKVTTNVLKMKKTLIFAGLLAAFVALQAQDFYAVTPSGHRLYYSITSATEHTVSVVMPTLYEDASFFNNQFWGQDVDLVIPDTVYNGGTAYRVTGIGSQALNVPMHSLTIPRSMRTIGYYAFASGINEYSAKNNSGSVFQRRQPRVQRRPLGGLQLLDGRLQGLRAAGYCVYRRACEVPSQIYISGLRLAALRGDGRLGAHHRHQRLRFLSEARQRKGVAGVALDR